MDLKYPENQIVVLEEGIDYWFTNDLKKLNLIKEQLWKKKEKESNENRKDEGKKNEEENENKQNKESQKEHKNEKDNETEITVIADAGTNQYVNAVKVRVINVYHCPGSCMFVFFVYRFQNDHFNNEPFVYVYTGDYYHTPEMEEKLKTILGDHTNGRLVYDSTRKCPREVCYSLEEAQNRMCEYIEYQGDNVAPYKRVFLFLSDVIGMETVWLGVARKLDVKVYVDEKRLARLQCYLNEDDLQYIVTTDPKSAL